MYTRKFTHSKNSLAGLVAFSLVIFVMAAQLIVFHGLPQDVHGSSLVKDAKK